MATQTVQNVETLSEAKGKRLLTRVAERYGVDETKLMTTLKATAFKQRNGSGPTDVQMMALMIVAEQYQLNPFTKEIYAFPDRNNGIVPVVGVDGWSRIVNSHPEYQGMTFNYSASMVRPDGAKVDAHEWIECVMYRRDKEHPTIVREYLDEVYRNIDGPWRTHPKRMHRHKAMIQCARLAFGFVGIVDQDEAERISEVDISNKVSRVVEGEARATAEPTLSTGQCLNIGIVVDRLIERAKPVNAWQSAYEWLGKRFSGAEREYAINRLREAELCSATEAIPEADPVSAEDVTSGVQTTQSDESFDDAHEAESGMDQTAHDMSEQDSEFAGLFADIKDSLEDAEGAYIP
ncbi:phage recombination protein Bet [Pseudomonas sp. MAG002Y]|nr:phage recombination protein Bet [Pseudomonas sp. MAG002Y]